VNLQRGWVAVLWSACARVVFVCLHAVHLRSFIRSSWCHSRDRSRLYAGTMLCCGAFRRFGSLTSTVGYVLYLIVVVLSITTSYSARLHISACLPSTRYQLFCVCCVQPLPFVACLLICSSRFRCVAFGDSRLYNTLNILRYAYIRGFARSFRSSRPSYVAGLARCRVAFISLLPTHIRASCRLYCRLEDTLWRFWQTWHARAYLAFPSAVSPAFPFS